MAATRAALARHGQNLTLDQVAARLGLTKPAVFYFFRHKDHLLIELALAQGRRGGRGYDRRRPHAIGRRGGPIPPARNFAFHQADLERFRLIYVRAQVFPGAKDPSPPERHTRLYPVTARMYAALEAKLRDGPRFPRHLDARTLGVAVHLAAIGYATMAGELEGVHETMKLPFGRYIDELPSAIGAGFTPRTRRPRRPARGKPSPTGGRSPSADTSPRARRPRVR